MTAKNGTGLTHGGFWSTLTGGRAICPDGRVRAFRPVGQPDTFWTQPARVQAFGRTVSGYLTTGEDDAGDLLVTFNPTGKHAGVMTGE